MGKIHVVLLPGLHGTEELFKPFLDNAPSDLELSVVSYPVNQVLSYEALTDIVQERLRGKAPAFLLGESFSGPVALRWLLVNPKDWPGLFWSLLLSCLLRQLGSAFCLGV